VREDRYAGINPILPRIREQKSGRDSRSISSITCQLPVTVITNISVPNGRSLIRMLWTSLADYAFLD
jgi:hypothetical protein